MGVNLLKPKSGPGKIFKSDKNQEAQPGKIFSSNRPPSRHNVSSILDAANDGATGRGGNAARGSAHVTRKAVGGAVKGGIKGAKRGAKIGGAAGKGAGAGAGAAIGSIVPGAGTAVGAKIGSQIGGIAGKGVGAAAGAGAGAGVGAAKGAAQGMRDNQQAGQQAKLGTSGMKNLAGKGVNAAKQFAGRSSGVGQVGEQAKDLKALATGSMKEKAKAAVNTGNRIAANVAGAGVGAGVIQKGLEVAENKNLWIALILIVFFIFFFFLSGGIDQPASDQNQNAKNTLQVSVTCNPAQVTVGQTSLCTVDVTDANSEDDITVVVTIYPFAQYVANSASPKGVYNATQHTVTWDAKTLKFPLTAPIALPPLSLTVTKTTNQQGVPIVVTATAGGGTAGGGGDVPANNSTCGGKYTLGTKYENFGDPQCNFTQQALGTLIKQLDPANALTWNCIAEHESSYNPNAYLQASTSGLGAYGLFQLNPKGQGNGQYDAGNVNWPVQTSNAINYRNKVINGSWAYWETYNEYCSNVQ